MTVKIIEGDALAMLRTLPAGTFQCCVTSPPYFGLRDYGVEGQMGLEESPEAFVAGMVAVFAEVRRVLRDDGTLWLNIGDSYCSTAPGTRNAPQTKGSATDPEQWANPRPKTPIGMKPKDLIGIPWMLAFALRADGWFLRCDVIWSKPNPMPESVTDRCTKAHEYVFLLTKQPRYFYDADAVREGRTSDEDSNTFRGGAYVEGAVDNATLRKRKVVGNKKIKVPGGWDTGPGSHGTIHRSGRTVGEYVDKQRGHSRRHAGFNDRWDAMSKDEQAGMGRNSRSVWSIAIEPFSGAHFATMPTELARRCILAGSREGDAVLDPFGGAGTTALVAERLKRDATIIELNPAYAAMARARIVGDSPLFAEVEHAAPQQG